MTTDHIESAREAGRVATELNVRSKLPEFPYQRYSLEAKLSREGVKKLVRFYEDLIASDTEPVEPA